MKLLMIFAGVLTLSVALFLEDSDPEIKFVEGGVSGTGLTTTYWDCCKPSCSWSSNAVNTSAPVTSCAVDGITPLATNIESGCAKDGTAYMCNSQQPFVVNSTLAYGFSAASFVGGVDQDMCCSCVLLSFLGALTGKHFLVQITNTGSDLNQYQFDLAFPGGGVGIFTRGCSTQWDAPEHGWGRRYGGVESLEECEDLPDSLQSGCKFRYQFMEGVINPNVTFQEVVCPTELTSITGCSRNDLL